MLSIVPKTLSTLVIFMSKISGTNMYGIERFQPLSKELLQIMQKLVDSDMKQRKINQI